MSKPTSGRTSTGLISGITATAIVIADMVGVGVFTSLGFQITDIKSGFSLLLLWIVGGVVAICGAFCYAELATMFPRSSGEYNFLRRIYHPAFGFVAGWLSATVGFAAPIALAAMAFGSYFKSITPQAPPLMLGLGIIWLAALVHLGGVRFAGAFHNAWTILKLILIAVFIIAGFAIGNTQSTSFAPSTSDLAAITGAPFAISLVFVMYSYSGWNAATYIIEEVREPARNLPRALLAGTAIVIILYVGLNAIFLTTTPMQELAGQLDVATIAGKHVFGPLGGRIVGALISLGLISSISAMTWIGPRVTMAMGEDMPVLRLFSRKSKHGVPVIAIIFQLLISNLLLLTQSFEAVLDFIQFSLAFCSFFTVLGVIKMRITHPDLLRPYRAWGYPLTPFVFLSVTLFVLYYLLVSRPLQSLGGIAITLTGLLVYYASRQYSHAPASDVSRPVPLKAPSTISKLMATLLLAGALTLAAAPARSAETSAPDDAARFLAGLPPAADSSLASLTKSPMWREHARHFDSMFGKVEEGTLSKIRAFSEARLPEKHQTMLYMFSGPDFLYAVTFFPSATTYVLSGREPVGAVPQLTDLPHPVVDSMLHNLESSLGSLLRISFFITKDMKTQLQGGPVYGTLPILYVFLARTGKTIHDVSFVSLDADGNIEMPPAPGDQSAAKTYAQSAAKGVKIVFSAGDGPNQALYYFSTNLADDGVKSSGILQFCDRLGVADSFFKSASYLTFSGNFNKVRNFVLNRSATIVQDDSGIPLAYFDPKKWRLQPFGRYLGPISEFPACYQPAMAELFRKGNPGPIDFGLGYRWRRNESNLLVAQRIGPLDETEISFALTTGSELGSGSTGSSPSCGKFSDTAAKWPPRRPGFSIYPFR
jgi:APA family basic amino acid/polyamine antiporter